MRLEKDSNNMTRNILSRIRMPASTPFRTLPKDAPICLETDGNMSRNILLRIRIPTSTLSDHHPKMHQYAKVWGSSRVVYLEITITRLGHFNIYKFKKRNRKKRIRISMSTLSEHHPKIYQCAKEGSRRVV
jgi:hypothetical protein